MYILRLNSKASPGFPVCWVLPGIKVLTPSLLDKLCLLNIGQFLKYMYSVLQVFDHPVIIDLVADRWCGGYDRYRKLSRSWWFFLSVWCLFDVVLFPLTFLLTFVIGKYRKSYERECISWFMGTSNVLKVLKIARAVGECNLRTWKNLFRQTKQTGCQPFCFLFSNFALPLVSIGTSVLHSITSTLIFKEPLCAVCWTPRSVTCTWACNHSETPYFVEYIIIKFINSDRI